MNVKDIQMTNCVVWFGSNKKLKQFVAHHDIKPLGGINDDDLYLCLFATGSPVTVDEIPETSSLALFPKYHYLEMEDRIARDKQKQEQPVIQKDSDLVVIFCNIVAILSVYLSKIIIDIRPMSTSNKSILMITCCFIIVIVAIIDIDHFDMLRKPKK
jgi:hypothetical protein